MKMNLKFAKATDVEHKVKLVSWLISVEWCHAYALAGEKAIFEVYTAFVGYDAPITVNVKNAKGRLIDKLKSSIRNNKYRGEISVPANMKLNELIHLEVDLPDNGISGKSLAIPVIPRASVNAMKWNVQQAKQGDVVSLTAGISGVQDDSEVIITIYEYDRDNIYERIVDLPTAVKNGKIEVFWEFEFQENLDDIPTEQDLQKYGRHYQAPQYFFTIMVENKEFGRKQESGLLTLNCDLTIDARDAAGKALANATYLVSFAGGTQKQGTLDGKGHAVEQNVPPGKVAAQFSNASGTLVDVDVDLVLT